jgi:CBS domain-containing protein
MAIEHLVACGFPRCEGGIMASNPKWCQPYSAWRRQFDQWVTTPDPQEILYTTIFFDFRGGHGHLELTESLRGHLMQKVRGKEVFLRHLAKDTLTTPSALTFFRNFVVEKEGRHAGRLDLKHKGLVPFIDYSRLMSLAHGVRETNTLERMLMLYEADAISRDFYLSLSQAFEFQMRLRLVHQQMQHEEGLEPDNFIDPRDLSDMERRNLKEALGVVGEIKGRLKSEYRLDVG